jgi:hypothetical protein
MTGSDTLRRERRFQARLWSAGAALLGTALCVASQRGGSPDPLLAALAPAFEAVLALGAALHHEGGVWLAAARLPVLAVVAAALVVHRHASRPRESSSIASRGTSDDAPLPLLGALAVAGCAQSYLLEDRLSVAVVLYALGIALFLWRRGPVPEVPGPSPRAWALLAALLVLYLSTALYALDLVPEVHYDENVYLVAARMARGEVEPGPIDLARSMQGIYPYERFRAHFIPLGLHAAALSLFPRGVIATRLVGVAAGALSLLVAAAALRRHFGTPAVAWMLALSAVSPLMLGYTRVGLYVPLTLLHGALVLAAFLRFRERADLASSAALGLLLGCTLFLYQLSWFVPVLVVLASLSTPDLLRRKGFVQRASLAALVAVALTLPGVWWQWEGFRVVAEQSVLKGLWQEEGTTLRGPVLVPTQDLLLPEGSDVDAIRAALEAADIRSVASYTRRGRTVLRVRGGREEVPAILAAQGAGHSVLLADSRRQRGVVHRTLAQLDLLLRSAHLEIKGVLTDVPVITAAMAPLVVLGIAEGLRRARAPAVRVTVLWVVVGGLLPAVLAGSAPRRSVLALPAALLLAGLPLVVVGSSLARSHPRGRAVAAGLGVALFVVASSLGLHHYFAHWTGATSFQRNLPSQLQLVEALRALPEDETVFLPRRLSGFAKRIRHSDPAAVRGADRIVPVPQSTPVGIRAFSCATDPPFTWIVVDDDLAAIPFRSLVHDFEVRVERRPGFRLYRVAARRPNACTGRGP